MKKKSILKNANLIFACAMPLTFFIGIATSIPYCNDEFSLYKEAKEIKERIYQEYILTDEFIEKQLEFSNSLSNLYHNGAINNESYQEQISYMTSKQYAFDLLETSDYGFLKNEFARAEEFENQSDKNGQTARTALTISGSVLLASALGFGATRGVLKLEEKKEIDEAQDASHKICKEVLEK